MGDEEEGACKCNTGLGLGIGVGEFIPKGDRPKKKQVVCLDLSFPLHMKEETIDGRHYKTTGGGWSLKTIDQNKCGLANMNMNCISNNNDDIDSNNNNNNCSTKKLRLTKEQSTLLEESFKLHSTLNPAEKQTLAEKLNLRPRQVEVWFQNRRARTKLKQTEVDCEFLKKCCESLSDENHRLKKELQELRSLNLEQTRPPITSPSLFIQFQKASTLCPSCDKIAKASSAHTTTATTATATAKIKKEKGAVVHI